jgi:transcriptional regulator with XRE-family HTH domain
VARRFNYERLRGARKDERLNAEVLGQALGRSASLVYMVEGGHRIPPPELLAEWCEMLRVPIDYVFTEEVPA